MKKIIGVTLAIGAASVFALSPITAIAADSGKVPCYGVNSCKGKSECKTATSECKGHNNCKGKGSKMMTAKRCAKKGGTTDAPAADASAPAADTTSK